MESRVGPDITEVSEFWFNFARFVSKTKLLRKLLNDSTCFCVDGAQKHCFLCSSTQNHAESFRIKNFVLDPKHAKLDQQSDFGHVRTYCWLNKLRNIQSKTYGKHLGHIYIYIYIHVYISSIFSKWFPLCVS